MGKAITVGFAPMGATIVTSKVAKSVEGEIGFYSTYGWHPSPHVPKQSVGVELIAG